jgi:hypothetical protein
VAHIPETTQPELHFVRPIGGQRHHHMQLRCDRRSCRARNEDAGSADVTGHSASFVPITVGGSPPEPRHTFDLESRALPPLTRILHVLQLLHCLLPASKVAVAGSNLGQPQGRNKRADCSLPSFSGTPVSCCPMGWRSSCVTPRRTPEPSRIGPCQLPAGTEAKLPRKASARHVHDDYNANTISKMLRCA